MPGVKGTMEEFGAGKLHSGSKTGPVVKSRAQAIAIGLSEERKAGHAVEKKHSSHPFGQTTSGPPNQHHVEQGHMMQAPKHGANDGAGRHGADATGHREHSEHKEPVHPSKAAHAPIDTGPGPMGNAGQTLALSEAAPLIGHEYKQSDHQPAVLRHSSDSPGGHPGMHAGMGTKPHGFGHQAHQKSGVHRNSGHPGAHRIGKR